MASSVSQQSYAEALERLVRLYDAVGTKEKAVAWRVKLDTARIERELWQDLLAGQEARYRFLETGLSWVLTSWTSCSRASVLAMCHARIAGPAIFGSSTSPVSTAMRRRCETILPTSKASTTAENDATNSGSPTTPSWCTPLTTART